MGKLYLYNMTLLTKSVGPCIKPLIFPGHQAHSSKPTEAACGGWMGQTDGWTQDSFVDPATHSMQAMSVI